VVHTERESGDKERALLITAFSIGLLLGFSMAGWKADSQELSGKSDGK
jgi:hypothetical protein